MTKTTRTVLITMVTMLTLMFSATVSAENWKRGRIYYKMVCTECHKEAGKTISPSEMTMAEWKAYLKADKHDKTGKSNGSVKYFISQKYRESVKDENRAAEKLVDVPDDDLFSDIETFLIKGAKDGDQPARCS